MGCEIDEFAMFKKRIRWTTMFMSFWKNQIMHRRHMGDSMSNQSLLALFRTTHLRFCSNFTCLLIRAQNCEQLVATKNRPGRIEIMTWEPIFFFFFFFFFKDYHYRYYYLNRDEKLVKFYDVMG